MAYIKSLLLIIIKFTFNSKVFDISDCVLAIPQHNILMPNEDVILVENKTISASLKIKENIQDEWLSSCDEDVVAVDDTRSPETSNNHNVNLENEEILKTPSEDASSSSTFFIMSFQWFNDTSYV